VVLQRRREQTGDRAGRSDRRERLMILPLGQSILLKSPLKDRRGRSAPPAGARTI